MRARGRGVSPARETLPGAETAGQFVRFLAVGLANTVVGCAVYLVFLPYLSHTLAYGLAFIAGTTCAGVLHARVTFNVPVRKSSFLLTAAFYLVSYLVNAAVLELTVMGLEVDKRLAILAVVAVSVPVTFIATRFIFKGRT